MSQALPQPAGCSEVCDDAIVTQVPGPTGGDGADGADGTNGVNAYAVTTADFTQPAAAATVVVAVSTSAWMVIGQAVYVQNGGYYEVTAKPSATSVTLENLGYTENVGVGVNVPALNFVAPSGTKGLTGSAGSSTLDDLSPTTTKGDLLADNGANSPNASLVRQAVGANNTVLAANSAQATGVEWKVPKLEATASLDFAAFAGLDSQSLTIALAGAVVGDPVTLGCPSTIPALLVPFAFVSAANVVTVRLTAVAAVADPVAMNYTVRINKL